MKNVWRLLDTPPSNGAWNMAVDESILERIGRGEASPTLRLYAWHPPCLSLGRAQSFNDADAPRLKANGWEVVRRLTGGRAILHTDELTYSVIGSADEPAFAGGVLESYNRIAQALLFAVRELGLPVEMKAGHVSSAINPVCFEAPSAYEIIVNGKKLIGSAQARRRDGVLQHGSLPLAGDLTRVCQALTFTNEAERELAAQRLLKRATTMASAWGEEINWETVAQSYVRGFETQLGIRFEREELSASESERADELVEKKYANPAWTERI
jgi:lipoate-protein ligase A